MRLVSVSMFAVLLVACRPPIEVRFQYFSSPPPVAILLLQTTAPAADYQIVAQRPSSSDWKMQGPLSGSQLNLVLAPGLYGIAGSASPHPSIDERVVEVLDRFPATFCLAFGGSQCQRFSDCDPLSLRKNLGEICVAGDAPLPYALWDAGGRWRVDATAQGPDEPFPPLVCHPYPPGIYTIRVGGRPACSFTVSFRLYRGERATVHVSSPCDEMR